MVGGKRVAQREPPHSPAGNSKLRLTHGICQATSPNRVILRSVARRHTLHVVCSEGRQRSSSWLSAEKENSDLDGPAASQKLKACCIPETEGLPPAYQGAQGKGREFLAWGSTFTE